MFEVGEKLYVAQVTETRAPATRSWNSTGQVTDGGFVAGHRPHGHSSRWTDLAPAMPAALPPKLAAAWPNSGRFNNSAARSRRAALTDGEHARCVRPPPSSTASPSASVAVRYSPSAATGHWTSGLPKNPGTGWPSALGSVSRNRRSRNRFAFSHDVSDANVQQWHAAPCRKSSGSLGVRMAHTGSDEQRAARRNAEMTSPCRRLDRRARPARRGCLRCRTLWCRSAGRPRLPDSGTRASRRYVQSGWLRRIRKTSPSHGSVRATTCAAASTAARAAGCRGRRLAVSEKRRRKFRRFASRWAAHSAVARCSLPRLTSARLSCRKIPSPRSSVAGIHAGLPLRVSLTRRLARSLTRSISSSRVNPMKALTFFIWLTATTRLIAGEVSGPRGISVTMSPLVFCCCGNSAGFCRYCHSGSTVRRGPRCRASRSAAPPFPGVRGHRRSRWRGLVGHFGQVDVLRPPPSPDHFELAGELLDLVDTEFDAQPVTSASFSRRPCGA